MFKVLFALFVTLNAHAGVLPGEVAPDFSAQSSQGETVHLSDYKGKLIVLEWTNFGCPFVKKHYNSENMQKLQKEFTQKGVVWLSIVSSAEGKQGFSSPKQAEQDRIAHKSNATKFLLDPKGITGKLFGAQTTPHMFVINAEGKVVYAGAIDDTPSADAADVKTAKNYVRMALNEVLAGKPVTVANTKSYGCSVKY